MLTTFEAGFAIDTLDAGARANLATTTLSQEQFTWQQMVEVFVGTFRYVALVVLDDSEHSQAFAKALSTRYLDIDRITGKDLVVFTTVPPPKEWFSRRREVLASLPETALRFQEREVSDLGTEEGQTAARYNSAQLIQEFFETKASFPAIVFLSSRASIDEPGTNVIDGIAFDISGFATERDVEILFSSLCRFATDAAKKDADVATLAKTAFSAANPTALRWRNAFLKTRSLLEVVAKIKDSLGAILKK